MSEKVYHFGFGVDANYVKYAGILMTNLTELHPRQRLCFHFACDGIEADDQKRLAAFARQHRNVKIKLYDLSSQLDLLNPISKAAPQRLHRAVLLRILLPSVINTKLERLVYMDVDVICCQPLDELFSVDLEGHPAGAVAGPDSKRNADRLKLKSGRNYCAGLLVFNLPVWRRKQITQRVVSCYQERTEELVLLEQDALNLVLDGDFLTLDKKYNLLIEVNNPLMQKYKDQAAVLHCVNEAKQWTAGCLPEIRELYWQYVRISPWPELQTSEPTTVKAAFLAATTAEVNGEAEQAIKYYGLVINRFFEHYERKKTELEESVGPLLDKGAHLANSGDYKQAAREYGVAAHRLTQYYLKEHPELLK